MLDKGGKLKFSDYIALASLLITLALGVFVYFQNERLNNLSKSQLANEILISSPQKDNYNRLGAQLNISIEVTSNYDGAIPVKIKLVDVRLKGEHTSSDYEHTWLGKEEQIVEKDGKIVFSATFTAKKIGEYVFDYILYYNYPQKDFARGKAASYTLNLFVEK